MPTTPLREALALADAEIQAGRPGEALRQCDLLLGTHPRWLDAQRLKAKALVALNRLPEAEKLLDGILGCHPEDVDAFCDRAYLAQRKGDPLGALACYRRACELARENASLRAIHNQLAAQLSRPPYTPSHTGLARLYLRAELFAHALREWDSALQANPHRLDAQIGMAETQWRMGDTARAQEVCRYILRHMPNCIKPLLLLVVFEVDAGRMEEAQRLTQFVAEMDPEQHIAGALFSDLVAVGHAPLAHLFRSAVRTQTSPLLRDSQTGIFPAVPLPRPVAGPLPTGQLPTGPLFRAPAQAQPPDLAPTSKLNMPPVANGNGRDQGSIEDFFSQSRASQIPEEFQMVFKETEYMLWSRDNEEPITVEIPTITASTSTSNANASALPATPTPPTTDEADMGFVRWLQAQGARPLTMPLPAEDAVLPTDQPKIAVPPFLAQALADMGAAADDSAAVAPADSARATPAATPAVAEPPATPAQSAPVAADAPLAAPVPPSPPAPARSGVWAADDSIIARAPAPLPSEPDVMQEPIMPPEPAPLLEPVEIPDTPAAPSQDLPSMLASAPPYQEQPQVDVPAPADAVRDVDALDAALLPSADPIPASEYAPMALAFERVSPPPAPPVTPAAEWDSVPPDGPSAPAAPVASASDHRSEPSPPAPDPAPPQEPPAPLTIEAIQQGLNSAGFARLDTGRLAAVASSLSQAPEAADAPTVDVAQRLEQARSLRRAGRMGEALVEYRALVKATADRMPEIIRDLRDAAIEDPREGEIQRLLGDAYIRQGDYVEALEAYNHASALRHEVGN